jgi:hypothetical protein
VDLLYRKTRENITKCNGKVQAVKAGSEFQDRCLQPLDRLSILRKKSHSMPAAEANHIATRSPSAVNDTSAKRKAAFQRPS